MEISQVLTTQKEIAEALEKCRSNVKKAAIATRTAELQENKTIKINQLWGEFRENHRNLQINLPDDHPYIKSNLYADTQKIAEDALHYLQSWKLVTIKPATSRDEQNSDVPVNTAVTVPHVAVSTTSPYTPVTPTITTSFFNSPLQNTTTTWSTQPISIHQFTTPTTTYGNPSSGHFLNHPWNSQYNLPKLPTIQIQPFSGDWKDWQQFYEIFTNIIHNNSALSNTEKMQYLLNYLQGDAKKIVAHLHLSNNNYEVALQLIKNRYSNNRKVITNYINTILSMKKAEHRTI